MFAEYIALDAATRPFARDLDLSIFEGADYANLIPTQWPRNEKRFFADGIFYHADGKARMLPVQAPAKQDFGLILNTGRNRDQWHTMTRTGKAPKLGAHLAEPYLEIHPDDAAEMGVIHGDLVDVHNTLGRAILRALVTDRVSKGQPFAPMHWTRQTARGGTVNSVIASVTDPFSGQPALKRGRVSVSLFKANWYGFLASAAQPIAQTSYAAIARTMTGWQVEMAGVEAPEDWAQFARDIAQMPDATASISEDATQGTMRIALYDKDVLKAVFYASPQPVVLSRAAAIANVGTTAPALAALSGRMS